MEDNDPFFTLTIQFNERSRDSHGYTYTYTLIGKRLSKKEAFSGKMRGKELNNIDTFITIDQEASLIFILDKLATENYEKIYETKESGIIRTYSIRLAGAVNIAIQGGDELQADEKAKQLYELERILKLLLKGDAEGFEKASKRVLNQQ